MVLINDKDGEKIMDELKELFKKKIIWQEVEPGGVEFTAEVGGTKCELRMNDFPDEPLYTIKYKGKQMDFDDATDIWEIPSIAEN
jgi:hypothetical protein